MLLLLLSHYWPPRIALCACCLLLNVVRCQLFQVRVDQFQLVCNWVLLYCPHTAGAFVIGMHVSSLITFQCAFRSLCVYELCHWKSCVRFKFFITNFILFTFFIIYIILTIFSFPLFFIKYVCIFIALSLLPLLLSQTYLCVCFTENSSL